MNCPDRSGRRRLKQTAINRADRGSTAITAVTQGWSRRLGPHSPSLPLEAIGSPAAMAICAIRWDTLGRPWCQSARRSCGQCSLWAGRGRCTCGRNASTALRRDLNGGVTLLRSCPAPASRCKPCNPSWAPGPWAYRKRGPRKRKNAPHGVGAKVGHCLARTIPCVSQPPIGGGRMDNLWPVYPLEKRRSRLRTAGRKKPCRPGRASHRL